MLRIGDAERDAAAADLGEHYAAGRLTLEELNERLDAVFAAKTFGQLTRIMADLPGAGRLPGRRPAVPPSGDAGDARPAVDAGPASGYSWAASGRRDARIGHGPPRAGFQPGWEAGQARGIATATRRPTSPADRAGSSPPCRCCCWPC